MWSVVDSGVVTWTELNTNISGADLFTMIDVIAARRAAEEDKNG